MEPNGTSDKQLTEAEPYKMSDFEDYVTFCALGGLIVNDDGKISKMTTVDFCERIGVGRTTLWRWKKTPGFAMKVRARRDEVVPLARETAAFNQLFMLGMQMQDKRAAVDALKTYLGHAGNLQLPVQRADVKVSGGLADVLQAAIAEGIIEGEVIDPTAIDA